MVRQLVEALHGSVVLTSAPGQGTRFRVIIPVAAHGEQDAAREMISETTVR
jgi:signal transduction histidine kinase